MTDELDKLKRIMRGQAPKPDAAARERTIVAAMSAFDTENPNGFQGSRAEGRQTGRVSALLKTLFGRRSMNIARPRFGYALAATAVVAVLATTVVTTNQSWRETPIVVAIDTSTVAPVEYKILELAELNERETEAGAPVERQAPAPLITARKERIGAVPKVDTSEDLFAQYEMTELAPAGEPPALTSDLVVESMKKIIVTPRELRMRGEAASISGEPTIRFWTEQGRDRFTDIVSNPVKVVTEEPVSTFSIDVDTASYGFTRASLNNGVLPQKDAVRIEELINYFPYDYAAPDGRATPFAASVSVMPTPWNKATKLLHIGIKGYALSLEEKPRSNLVFLIDTSGSMNAPNKLPLLINAFKLLVDTLEPADTVAIVTYAGNAGVALEPTKVSDSGKILASLESLRSGGSTAGAEGIRQAYLLAERNFADNGVNRVILATDGDFNVGITDPDELKSYIERKRATGVFLSVLGFGMGNYNDALMQTLAQNGNGNAAYIDTLSEARKVLVEEATSTLFTIAKDVKLQIEFNPDTVAEYRLIGYETRLLNREDFNNDKVDAGDIGSGHTVTAIYELTPVGSGAALIDELRYQSRSDPTGGRAADEYAFLKIRFKLPDSDTSTLITLPVTPDHESATIAAAPREARFAAAVAGFGQLLRGGRYTGELTHDDVIELAQGARGEDPFGYRAEFINLVRLAKSAAEMEALKP
jgi:Ca-activated chloride channel family protein